MKKINYLLSTGLLVFLSVVSFSCGGNKNSQTDEYCWGVERESAI